MFFVPPGGEGDKVGAGEYRQPASRQAPLVDLGNKACYYHKVLMVR